MYNVNISKFFKSAAVAALYIASMLLFMILVSSDVLASSTGATSILPYESWLISFQKSMTGPVAFSVALLGIVGSGFALIFMGAELNRFIRTIIYLILVMTCLIGANAMMTDFFNGASIGQVHSSTEQDSHSLKPLDESKASKEQASTTAKVHPYDTLQAISQPQYALQPIIPVKSQRTSPSMSPENLEQNSASSHNQSVSLNHPIALQKQNTTHTDPIALQKQDTIQTLPTQQSAAVLNNTDSVKPSEVLLNSLVGAQTKTSQQHRANFQNGVSLGSVNLNSVNYKKSSFQNLEQIESDNFTVRNANNFIVRNADNFIGSLVSGDDSQQIMLWQKAFLSNVQTNTASLSVGFAGSHLINSQSINLHKLNSQQLISQQPHVAFAASSVEQILQPKLDKPETLSLMSAPLGLVLNKSSENTIEWSDESVKTSGKDSELAEIPSIYGRELLVLSREPEPKTLYNSAVLHCLIDQVQERDSVQEWNSVLAKDSVLAWNGAQERGRSQDRSRAEPIVTLYVVEPFKLDRKVEVHSESLMPLEIQQMQNGMKVLWNSLENQDDFSEQSLFRLRQIKVSQVDAGFQVQSRVEF